MEYNDFIEIIICPKCKKKLTFQNEKLSCIRCNLSFPFREGVPIMLLTEAATLVGQEIDDSIVEGKGGVKKFYSTVNEYLNTSGAQIGHLSNYLNFGYKSNAKEEYSLIQLPNNCLNKNSVKLTLEVIGDTVLTDKMILEIGCGRGGNIVTMSKYFNPKALIGIDITEASVQFCKDNNQAKSTFFCTGDAENVPFKENFFDVIFNLESSSLYPNIHKFYHEAYRLLKPGGYFLYSDVLKTENFPAYRQYLLDIGFKVLLNRDITSNILLSCEENAEKRKRSFLGNEFDAVEVAGFLAEPGSPLYESMNSGRSSYRILKLKKDVF